MANSFQKPVGVNSWGSADPTFDFKGHEQNPHQEQAPMPKAIGLANAQQLAPMPKEYNLNPILQGFADSVGGDLGTRLSQDPRLQAKLFDYDNLVKTNAGIFRKGEDGLKEIGTDKDGKPLYSAPEYLDPKATDLFNAGSSQLEAAGTVLDSVGAFSSPEEAKRFVGAAKKASDPRMLGTLHGMITGGDTQGATNSIMNSLGMKPLDGKSPVDDRDLANAFAAKSLVDNWQSMNNTQRSLSLATMQTSAFKYDDGKDIGSKVLVEAHSDNGAELTTGNALAFAGSGVNVPTLLKNWDQIDAMQRLTYGAGSASQMVATGQRMGFLGDATQGDAAIKADVQSMARLGFQAAPSAGLGAITGPSDNIPEGYQVVGGGTQPNTVIAVPQGAQFSTALANGSSSVVSLGSNKNLKPASAGAVETYLKWGGGSKEANNGVVGGTQFSSGLNKSGVLDDPYMKGSIVAASLHGNTIQQRGVPREAVDYNDAVSRLGVNSGINRKDVNLKQASKNDQNVSAILNSGAAATNMATKFGSTDAAGAAPYVNAAASGKQLMSVLNNPNATDKEKAEAVANAGAAGNGIAASLGSEAAAGAMPGVSAAMMAYSASKIVGSNMTEEQKAKALRRTGEDTAAAYVTLGVSSVVQMADRKLTGGKIDKLRDKADKLNPMTAVNEKIATKVLGGIGSATGGKSKVQQGRDQVRKALQDGIADKEFQVTLVASNSKADIGMDGHGGKHEFTNPDKSVDGKRSLSAYDVDYTNDLDYSSNMMTSALTRLIMGGKGKEIDQVAGQLGNAAIKEIGFGQEMTAENFNIAQTNARGFFEQKGIKTKEDAYALSNQAVAEGRMTEMDAVAVQQGINMAFDKNGYDTAGVLMQGRWKGLDVSSQIPASPGPNLDFMQDMKSGQAPNQGISADNVDKFIEENSGNPKYVVDTVQKLGLNPFDLNSSNYGGAKTKGVFSAALEGFIDPSTEAGGKYTPEQIEKLKEYGVQF